MRKRCWSWSTTPGFRCWSQGSNLRRIATGLARLLMSCAILLLAGNAPPAAANAVLQPVEGVDEGRAGLVRTAALHQVNELSHRRRLTTFFVNEQTPLYGVQLNYVNVGRGNLTFLNRDLVRLGRLPIVIGRVYDSQLSVPGDFGDGWKLSVAEFIQIEGTRLRYIDASGSEHWLTLEGGRIRSPYPHLTGIVGGRQAGRSAELEVGGLTKRFRQIGDEFYLHEVRNGEGDQLRLEYEGTRIVRVVSAHGRFVALHRDPNGLVTHIEDDAGRQVIYEYDGAARLISVTDVGGRLWRIEYDAAGRLTHVVDPRGVDALAATHGADGRVSTVRVLFDSMSFEYRGGLTVARNAFQQAASFWQDPSGLTSAVQDFAGSVTELTLSGELLPLALSFDGSPVARLAYDPDGRLQVLTNFVAGHAGTTRFEYDREGRLLNVRSDGEIVGEYGYDARGRVVTARDTYGNRSYEYEDRSIRRVRFGYAAADLETNELGLLTGFRRDDQTVRLYYDGRDQLRHLYFDVNGRVSETHFEYDASGLRTEGRYDLADEAVELTFGYDAVGNLTELASVTPDGQRGGQTYVLGEHNQLTILRGSRRPDLVFDYDLAGRPVQSRFVEHSTAYGYDDLGRLSAVYQNDVQVLESSYGPMDVDAATEADGQTAWVSVQAPVASSVFGPLEGIAYARTQGTPFGPIRFNASMARFVLAETAVPPPDGVLIASFKRRALPVFSGSHGYYGGHVSHVVRPEPMGFDKPSNGLFLPAEFSSLNCYYCYPYTSYWIDHTSANVYMTVNGTSSGTATGVVGQSTSISIAHSGQSPQCITDISPFWGFFFHFFSFGDGGYTTVQSPWHSIAVSTSRTYSAAGHYTIYDDIWCGCWDAFPTDFFGSLQRNVSICEEAQLDGFDFHANQFHKRLPPYPSRYFFGNPQPNTFRFAFQPLDDPELVPSEQRSTFEDGRLLWNTTKSMCGETYTSEMGQLLWRESGWNIIFEVNDELSPCGEVETFISGQTDIVRLRCLNSQTAAHEYGHIVGLQDGLPQSTDIMCVTNCGTRDVQAYNIRALLHHYFGGQ